VKGGNYQEETHIMCLNCFRKIEITDYIRSVIDDAGEDNVLCPTCQKNDWLLCGRDKMAIINLTPHPVNLMDGDGKIIRTWDKPDSDVKLPRLVEVIEKLLDIDGVKVVKKTYGRCDNLPERVDNVYYIVSGLIASAMRRSDLLVSNTVRNERGQIIGCDSFGVVI